jgi:hypothetical protein
MHDELKERLKKLEKIPGESFFKPWNICRECA